MKKVETDSSDIRKVCDAIISSFSKAFCQTSQLSDEHCRAITSMTKMKGHPKIGHVSDSQDVSSGEVSQTTDHNVIADASDHDEETGMLSDVIASSSEETSATIEK